MVLLARQQRVVFVFTLALQNCIHFSFTHVETATFHLLSSECHAGAPGLHSEAGSRRCHGEAGRAAHWLTPVCYMTLDVAETVIRSRRSVCLVLCCLFARGRKTIIFNSGREPRRARCQTPPLDEKDLKKKEKRSGCKQTDVIASAAFSLLVPLRPSSPGANYPSSHPAAALHVSRACALTLVADPLLLVNFSVISRSDV